MTPDMKDCSLEHLSSLFEDLKENLDDLCSSFDCLSSELGMAMDDISDDLDSVKTQFLCVGSLLTQYGKHTDRKKSPTRFSSVSCREMGRAEYRFPHPVSEPPF